MVSYYNPLAMYRQPQGMIGQQYPHPPGTNPAGWYQQQQPFEEHMSYLGGHHGVGVHHFGAGGAGDWAPECAGHFQPSPPISEASSTGAEGLSPGTQPLSRTQTSRSPYEWMRKNSFQTQSSTGKTRTKDKYRVVYTDTQRLELEKEFHYSRYITIRRKAELATSLGLSERQVKIWFQNRRAKERKQMKKREETEQKIKQETMDPLRNQPSGPPPMVLGNSHSLHPNMHGLPLM